MGVVIIIIITIECITAVLEVCTDQTTMSPVR